MPYRNIVKQFSEGAYYHAYNRGYNKQVIFHDKQDYATFMFLLKKYLDLDFREAKVMKSGEIVLIKSNSLVKDVELHAFSLMPNHFHMLIKQKSKKGMPKLLSRVSQAYTHYYNEKYEKIGSIWQGTYKAVLIRNEQQFLHVSRYIHINVSEILAELIKTGIVPDRDSPVSGLSLYEYSSYPTYLGLKKLNWLKTEDVLYHFRSTTQSKEARYKKFVEGKDARLIEDAIANTSYIEGMIM